MRVLAIESENPEVGRTIETLCGSMIDIVRATPESALATRDADHDVIVIEIGHRSPASELVQRMRLNKVRAPILLISPQSKLVEVVRSLSAGADDYMTLPLDGEALVRKLFQVNREHSARARPVLRIGKLKIDVERRRVMVNGERLHVTGKEFQILEVLATRLGTTVTKGEFLDHLYGGAYQPVLKIIDVFVCKLRKKIFAACGEHYIETIWGRGYVMRDPEQNVRDVRRTLAA